MLMPILGWYAGLSFSSIITGVDHWVAFGLLVLIGSKMIYDSTKKEAEKRDEIIKLQSLLILAVATSIDALMIGLSFAFLQMSILEPIIMIGFVTFILSFAGFLFGCELGTFIGSKVKIAGGVILIGIGIKILIEGLL